MRIFFLCLYLFISITLIILILLQKNLSSINIGTKNINKNLFDISTSNEFLTRLTIIFAFLFLILSLLQCNINNCIL
ncbi:Protein-export membrane protein SecG [Buchnera aphidicola (Chaitophorus sp. 3695)]|uniref:preprotein translocase subunit SecG n=1 Tax=Buchnera aphidicola TaxID=9 RepID=UPI003463E47D